jgi:hypothetical protein
VDVAAKLFNGMPSSLIVINKSLLLELVVGVLGATTG